MTTITLSLIRIQLCDLAAEIELGSCPNPHAELAAILHTIELGLLPLTPVPGHNPRRLRINPTNIDSQKDREQLRDGHSRLVQAMSRGSDQAAVLPAIQDALRNWPLHSDANAA